jgi:hypothetical protein
MLEVEAVPQRCISVWKAFFQRVTALHPFFWGRSITDCTTTETTVWPNYSSPWWWILISVVKSVDCLVGETDVLGKYLLQCRCVHHKSHMTYLGSNPGRRCWKPVTNRLSYDKTCVTLGVTSILRRKLNRFTTAVIKRDRIFHYWFQGFWVEYRRCWMCEMIPTCRKVEYPLSLFSRQKCVKWLDAHVYVGLCFGNRWKCIEVGTPHPKNVFKEKNGPYKSYRMLLHTVSS